MFIAKRRNRRFYNWESLKLADLLEAIIYPGLFNIIIVSVQSKKARALHIKRNRFWKLVSFDQKFGQRFHQTTRRKPAEVSLLSFHFASSWETSARRETQDKVVYCLVYCILFSLQFWV